MCALVVPVDHNASSIIRPFVAFRCFEKESVAVPFPRESLGLNFVSFGASDFSV